jgi:hypothetical protein
MNYMIIKKITFLIWSARLLLALFPTLFLIGVSYLMAGDLLPFLALSFSSAVTLILFLTICNIYDKIYPPPPLLAIKENALVHHLDMSLQDWKHFEDQFQHYISHQED